MEIQASHARRNPRESVRPHAQRREGDQDGPSLVRVRRCANHRKNGIVTGAISRSGARSTEFGFSPGFWLALQAESISSDNSREPAVNLFFGLDRAG
jgi:hypothetical protein